MKALNMISVLVIILITAMLFASCGTTATPAEATQKANETTALPTGAKPTTAATESATVTPAMQNTATEPTPTEAPQEQPQNTYEQPNYEVEQSGDLQMTISGTPVSVEWEDNDAVQALKELCNNQPLTISMSMYGGFEQVGSMVQPYRRMMCRRRHQREILSCIPAIKWSCSTAPTHGRTHASDISLTKRRMN